MSAREDFATITTTDVLFDEIDSLREQRRHLLDEIEDLRDRLAFALAIADVHRSLGEPGR